MNRTKNREVYILLILLLILVVYGFYTLLITPKMAEARTLKEQVASEDAIVRGMYTAILKYDTDAADLQEKQKQTKALTEHYYIRENQERYLDDLGKMLTDCAVSFEAIESEDPVMPISADEAGYDYESPYLSYIDDLSSVSNADGTIDVSQVLRKVDEISGEFPKMDQMQISLEAAGAYSAVYKLIEKLETSEKQIMRSVMTLDMVSGSAVAMEADPQVKVKIPLQFLRLIEMDCLSSEEFPKMPEGFTMPNDFVTGEYQGLFHF